VVPTTTCDQTTPSICTVGRASAVTVAGVPGSAGSSGAESARAVPVRAPPAAPPTSRQLSTPATSARAIADVRTDIRVPRSLSHQPALMSRSTNTKRDDASALIP
jgi:hypothetical protein